MPPKDIASMSKKDLKDYVNENGFFFHIQCDKIDKTKADEILTDGKRKVKKTGREVPEGESIMVFQGIASQNYAKGEKSRNGYKYDQNGWDFENYMANPIILWQHDTSYGAIGNAIAFWQDEAGNLNTMFYIDLETLEERHAKQVSKGFVTAISTGAIAQEERFEVAESGELLEEQDAEERFGWIEVLRSYYGSSDLLTLIVTKAEMLENSLVTIGSNGNAIAMQNAIGNHYQSRAEKYKKDHETSESPEAQEKPQIETPTVEEEQDAQNTESNSEEVGQEAETPTPTENVGDETEGETPSDENSEKLNDAIAKIAELENTISEMKQDSEAQKLVFDSFKDEVYDTMQAFIKSHNDAIDNLQEVNTALGSIRVSKGLPHIKSNEVKEKTPLSGLVKAMKNNL